MILSAAELGQVRESHADETIAFRAGCYDLVHEGHLQGLDFASQQADILVVGVWSDRLVRRRKGEMRPIIPEMSRAALLSALEVVDYALVMPEEGRRYRHPTLEVVASLQPDTVVFPRRPGEMRTHENDDLIRAMGTNIVYDVSLATNSTTAIINRILERHEATA